MEFGKKVFVHLRRVNIDMDDFCSRGELRAVAGHAVGKARASGNEQVAFLCRAIGRISAVHPDHAEVERVGSREAAQPHHGGGNRGIHALRQPQKLRRCARGDHAAADIEQRLLCLPDCLSGARKAVLARRLCRRHSNCGPRCIIRVGERDVFWDIDQNGPFSPGARNAECLTQAGGKILYFFDDEAVLGDRHRDAGGVNLLEAVAPKEGDVHVARDKDDGDGIHKCGGDACDEIGGARARGGKADSRFPACTSIALGCVRSALFMGCEDMADFTTISIERIIHREDGCAGVPENCIHSLLQQDFHNDLCACFFHARSPPLSYFK